MFFRYSTLSSAAMESCGWACGGGGGPAKNVSLRRYF